MILDYQYRLRPTKEQQVKMEDWLELLRRQYNCRLAERFDWWKKNRCNLNGCPLICHLPQLKEQPNYYPQKRDLINTKKLFPQYKEIHSQVRQSGAEYDRDHNAARNIKIRAVGHPFQALRGHWKTKPMKREAPSVS